jgi:hypothetical protein
VCLPLGNLLRVLGERSLGRSFDLSLVEQALVAFYLAGGLFFVVASIPLPLFGLPFLLAALALGFGHLVYATIRSRGRGFDAWGRFLSSPAGLLLTGTSIALLVFEVLIVSPFPLPNTYDGSTQVIFVQLLLKNHTVQATLAPFAPAGVIYPQGTSVWLSVPSLLFAWPVARLPVLLLPLFLTLSIPAAYAWGERLGGFGSDRGRRTGTVFALFFASVATWPRFFLSGSYDFVFAVPLLFLILGWLRSFVQTDRRTVREVLGFGVLVGLATSLSVTVGEAMIPLLVGFLLIFQPGIRHEFLRWMGRVAAIVVIQAAFLLRSVVGIIQWFSYPFHVLTETGSPPFPRAVPGFSLTFGTILGQLDPFVPWDPKLSPVPILDVELALLFVVGLVLLWSRTGPLRTRLPRFLSDSISVPIVVGAFVVFLFALVLLFGTIPNEPLQSLGAVTSLLEVSILLFIFFQGIALLPILAAVEFWKEGPPATTVTLAAPTVPARSRRKTFRKNSSGRLWLTSQNLAVAVVVMAPLLAGAGATVMLAPRPLYALQLSLSNVSQGDLDALMWSRAHLNATDGVLVAPGSVGQFLPAYIAARLIYPMNPPPANLSYDLAVENLTAGNYTPAVRLAMCYLNVTNVVVTGQSNRLWPPFRPSPLLGSTDFSLLFHEQDAYIFSFHPPSNYVPCAAGLAT